MIDIRKLKELVKLMVENDLSELDLRDQEETVTIKRGPNGVPVVQQPVPAGFAPDAAASQAVAASDGKGEDDGEKPDDESGLVAVESPMVGTFYAAPNPDSAPFVTAGASVSPETVVCLIEAMKVFNEIKAECNGTIERVLVSNGDAVEFGQKLFLVRPN